MQAQGVRRTAENTTLSEKGGWQSVESASEKVPRCYRFAFNGQEKVDEINGSTGTHNTAQFWEYDTRTGRRWNLDPKPNPSISEYACFANNPILFSDLLGDTTKVGNWMREHLPGLIAAPLAGLVDGFEGLGRATGSLFSGVSLSHPGRTRGGGSSAASGKKALRDASAGFLSMFGLADVVYSDWDRVNRTTNLRLPKSLGDMTTEVEGKVWSEHPDASMNGMHAWHAGSNAAGANKLGPVGAVGVWLAGLVHETPIDGASFRAEQRAQGTINHILDSGSDIIANTFGVAMGLLLPRKWAIEVGVTLGNQIPGPGDPDPRGVGTGGYTGDPLDAWGQYPKLYATPSAP